LNLLTVCFLYNPWFIRPRTIEQCGLGCWWAGVCASPVGWLTMSENTSPQHNSTSSTAPQHTPSEAPHEAPRNFVVGVAGGIAAYKAAHLVRNFKEHGDDVR